MESSSQKLIEKINAVLSYLYLSDEIDAIFYAEFFEYIRAQLHELHDLKEIAQNILHTYGGMATFSDVEIYKEGIYLKEEHHKFADLRNDLYLLCEDIVLKTREPL